MRVVRQQLPLKRFVSLSVNQLDTDLDLATVPQKAALDERVYTELFCDFLGRQLAVPVPFRRLPRCNPKISNLRKLCDQDVLQAINVIVLLRITSQVAQRQHREGPDVVNFRSVIPGRPRPKGGQQAQHDYCGDAHQQTAMQSGRVRWREMVRQIALLDLGDEAVAL